MHEQEEQSRRVLATTSQQCAPVSRIELVGAVSLARCAIGSVVRCKGHDHKITPKAANGRSSSSSVAHLYQCIRTVEWCTTSQQATAHPSKWYRAGRWAPPGRLCPAPAQHPALRRWCCEAGRTATGSCCTTLRGSLSGWDPRSSWRCCCGTCAACTLASWILGTVTTTLCMPITVQLAAAARCQPVVAPMPQNWTARKHAPLRNAVLIHPGDVCVQHLHQRIVLILHVSRAVGCGTADSCGQSHWMSMSAHRVEPIVKLVHTLQQASDAS